MNLKIVSWNVNGIRAVERKGFVQWLEDFKPDVLCIQETKAWEEQLSDALTKPDNYHVKYAEAKKKGYSGTAIFSAFEPLNFSIGLPDKLRNKYEFVDDKDRDSFTEGRVTVAEYDTFYVVSVYTPNVTDKLERLKIRSEAWDPAFLDYIKELKKKKSVIVCGDINVAHTEDDLARPKQNVGKKGFTEEEIEGINNVLDAGFIDSFRLFTSGNGHYSWWSHWGNARENNVGWRIDYILVSEDLKDKVISSEIHPDILGSDHAPVSMVIEV